MDDSDQSAVNSIISEEQQREDAEQQRQEDITNKGLQYRGDYMRYQPFAERPGIYCIKPELYTNCGLADVKVGFTNNITMRFSTYATAFVKYRILFVIVYADWNGANRAEQVMKNYFRKQSVDVREHVSGRKSEWQKLKEYEMVEDIIPNLVMHMYDTLNAGYDMTGKDIFDKDLSEGSLLWVKYEEKTYPARVAYYSRHKHDEMYKDIWESEIVTGNLIVVDFFDDEKNHGAIPKEDVEVSDLDLIDYDEDEFEPEIWKQVQRALKYMKRWDKVNREKTDRGLDKPTPSRGWLFDKEPVDMEMNEQHLDKYMIDDKVGLPYIDRNNREFRLAKQKLDKATKTKDSDPDAYEEARQEYASLLKRRTVEVTEERYASSTSSVPPPTPEKQIESEMEEAFGLVTELESGPPTGQSSARKSRVTRSTAPKPPPFVTKTPPKKKDLPSLPSLPVPEDTSTELEKELEKERRKRTDDRSYQIQSGLLNPFKVFSRVKRTLLGS